MDVTGLHHVALATRDLARSTAFYENCFGLKQKPRPPFKAKGTWLDLFSGQLHIIEDPEGTFRPEPRIDISDVHFALNVRAFEAALAALARYGYGEALPDGDPLRLLVLRNGVAGFSQAYLLDPDWHIVEINDAAGF